MSMKGDFIRGGQHGRRLPVYLLLDCSSSMTGAPIVAVNEGLGIIYTQLMNDPQAVDTVHISIIRFADQADLDPLIAIDQFTPPALIADGLTAMGAAVTALVDSIEHDLVPNDPARNIRGDFRPIVFLLTDGEPTDDFRTPIQRLKALRSNQKPTIIALGCGPYVNSSVLHEIADPNVFIMHQTSPDTIKSFFKWLSSSVTTASRTAAGGSAANMTSPATIPGITYDPS